MSIHSHLQYDQSTSHARVPAGGIHLIASIDSVSEAQVTASFFGSTKSLHGKVATPSDETTTHNHSNQQYSITAVTTSAGAIAERYAYSAYGEPTILDGSGSAIGSSSISNRYSYTGREWDATIGLYHFRARWMSPKTGQFLGRDPIEYVGSEWHLYELFESKVLIATDPSGLMTTIDACMLKPTPGQQLACLEILMATAGDKAGKINMLINKIKYGLPRPPIVPPSAPTPAPVPVIPADGWIGGILFGVGVAQICEKLAKPVPIPRPDPRHPDNPPVPDGCFLIPWQSKPPEPGKTCFYCFYMCPGVSVQRP